MLLLRDTDDDGVADKQDELLRLETEDDYPHNALGGIDQTADGSLSSAWAKITACLSSSSAPTAKRLPPPAAWTASSAARPTARNLEHIARGVWNPFSLCVLPDGRIFAVDNDPDASPPCRLLHVVEGGDYGYLYQYGRAGTHPLQCLERRAARHAADGLRHGRSADGHRRPRRQPVGHQLGRPPHRALPARAARRIVRRRRGKSSCKATPTSGPPAWPSRRTARCTSATGCCAITRCTATAASGGSDCRATRSSATFPRARKLICTHRATHEFAMGDADSNDPFGHARMRSGT